MLKKPLVVMKIGVLWFYGIALIAHFITPETYSIFDHSVSQLGAQEFDYAWIMSIAFIGSAFWWIYGLLLNIKIKSLNTFVSVGFLLISLFIIVAGIFQVSLPGYTSSVNVLEENLHLLAGHGSQVIGLFILIEHIFKSTPKIRKKHFIVFIILFILSIFFEFATYKGVSQRILAITHSYWTFTLLNVYK